jgi:leucyl aminopeptidase
LNNVDSMMGMHLDKHGSVSVMSAMRSIARLKLPINITASLGFVENSIDCNAYRPGDIIESRKGLTVEIGNTDAEGRLVLADVMHWTQ